MVVRLKNGQLEDNYIAQIPNSDFRENRPFRRRFKRFIKKRRFLKAKKQIQEFPKFSMICEVKNPALPINEEEGFIKLFLMMTKEAWNIFLQLGGLAIKFLKGRADYLIKLLMKHPYFSMFTVLSSCSLLLLNHLTRKFGRKVTFYDRILTLILSLIATLLLYVIIRVEGFKTIQEWLRSVLIQIIFVFRSFSGLIDSKTQDTVYNSKPSKAKDFKTFAFFSIITILTTRYLLNLFKHKLVGDVPFYD